MGSEGLWSALLARDCQAESWCAGRDWALKCTRLKGEVGGKFIEPMGGRKPYANRWGDGGLSGCAANQIQLRGVVGWEVRL